MDALQLLVADHNRVRGLFANARSAHEAGDVATLAQVAKKIFDELDVHTRIEEEVFYPEVKRMSDLAEMVAEGLEEHHVVDQLIEEMKILDPGAESWAAKLTVMMENVEHHAGEEESEMFPAVRKSLDNKSLTALAERLEARKAELGAPTMADKEHLSTEELARLARSQDIPGRSKMNREELLATVAPG
ncbi:MAG: hemerythrin domain-containing protein [Acidimicrobiia bacterium]